MKTSDEKAVEAETILIDRKGADAASRGAGYRAMGWTGYSPDAPAYSAVEVAAERDRIQLSGIR